LNTIARAAAGLPAPRVTFVLRRSAQFVEVLRTPQSGGPRWQRRVVGVAVLAEPVVGADLITPPPWACTAVPAVSVNRVALVTVTGAA
jgi:hypothetical protein